MHPVQMEKNVQAIWNIGTMSMASNRDNPSFSLAICKTDVDTKSNINMIQYLTQHADFFPPQEKRS